MKLFVLISTLGEGIRRIPVMLLPQRTDVHYVVVWQRNHVEIPMADASSAGDWTERADVTLVEMEGIGLCRSRNRAIQLALDLQEDPLDDAVFLIADDDEHFDPEAFQRILATYQKYDKLDAALFRLRSSSDNQYFKPYPSQLTNYKRRPRSYYPCSWEITLRHRVCLSGIRFDERFGLGADKLCAGEEDVLLTDVSRRGFNILIVPEDIGTTDPVTTGDRVLDAKVLRSKGAVYGYQLSLPEAFIRSWREAISLAIRHRTSAMYLFRKLWYGVKYIRS